MEKGAFLSLHVVDAHLANAVGLLGDTLIFLENPFILFLVECGPRGMELQVPSTRDPTNQNPKAALVIGAVSPPTAVYLINALINSIDSNIPRIVRLPI